MFGMQPDISPEAQTALPPLAVFHATVVCPSVNQLYCKMSMAYGVIACAVIAKGDCVPHRLLLVAFQVRAFAQRTGIAKSDWAPSLSFISGAVAGAAATAASYPFDLLRTTLAAQGEPKV